MWGVIPRSSQPQAVSQSGGSGDRAHEAGRLTLTEARPRPGERLELERSLGDRHAKNPGCKTNALQRVSSALMTDDIELLIL